MQKDIPGYYPGDFNMDGLVNSNDKNLKWTANVGKRIHQPDLIVKSFVCGNQLFDDRNGVYYETIQIGSLCWMAENLNYATGSSWCYNNIHANCDTLGRLYYWNTIMSSTQSSNTIPSGVRGICPPGWHLPAMPNGAWLRNILTLPPIAW